MPLPHSLTASTSHVAAIVKPEGHAVVVFGYASTRNPCGPSSILMGGMPSRSTGAMLPTYAHSGLERQPLFWPVSGPCSMPIFSLTVMFARRACARSSGVSLMFDHGPGTSTAWALDTSPRATAMAFIGAVRVLVLW